MRPRVSLCVIARDEEGNLPGCLECARGLVDEIVVVDTGSSDRTRDVAWERGAIVHEFAWEDDFAEARNESLRHAQGEWIFWLDADERLDANNREKLRTLMASLPEENVAYTMTQRSPGNSSIMEADQVRLFRNRPEIRWQHRVHEQIVRSIEQAGGRLQKTDIIIDHTGYMDCGQARKKTERNLRLLELERVERPDDAFTLFNLGWAYHELGRTTEALTAWRQSLARVKPGAAIERKLYALLAQGHFRLGSWQEALNASRAGQERYPADVELLFEESVALYQLGDLAGAEMALLRLLQSPPGDHVAMTDASLRGNKARNNLGLIYLQQGRWADAEAQWRLLLAESADYAPAWAGLAESLLGQKRFGELEACITRVTDDNHRAILRARAYLARGEFGQARRLLEATISQSPAALVPRVLLSHALLQEGVDWTAAERALRGILAIDPSNVEAQRNLGVLLRQQGTG